MIVNKSKSAFRTIAELAEELGVATHVLRFWESKFEQIKPMKRAGGRRYYRPDDVELIKTIKNYLYEKRYTIEGVQKLLKEKGVKVIVGEEIQKDFFDNADNKLEIDASSREVLVQIRDSLQDIKSKLQANI
jgi:DNA-binding transcriptional MerR regulator